MEFEWDTEKNKKNLEKHGIDFTDAVLIFESPTLVHEDKREDYGEKRFCGVGVLKEIAIVVSYTLREGRIRIISARKARKDERQRYRSIYTRHASEGEN